MIVRVNEAHVVNNLEQRGFLANAPSLPTTAMALPVQGPAALPRTEGFLKHGTLDTNTRIVWANIYY